MRTFRRRILIVNLVVNMLVSLLSLLAQEIPNEFERLDRDDQSGSEGGLPSQQETRAIITTQVLMLPRVDINDVIPALESLGVGKKDEALGVRVELSSGFLHNGPPLVNLGQSLVAEIIGLQHVWFDILVGFGQIWKDGDSKGLVGRVAELKGLLAVRV